jgi:hypothetical protein
VWRLDEDLMDATTKRQYAAIEDLPNLRRFTEAELRLRSIILGSPEVLHMPGHEMLITKPHHLWGHTYSMDTVLCTLEITTIML